MDKAFILILLTLLIAIGLLKAEDLTGAPCWGP